jgi:hypothetical protein
VTENELKSLFEEIEAPAGLDRWRERIADVHAESVEISTDEHNGATIVALPTGRDLRPTRHRRRSVAMAAAAAVVVGLAGGVVVATQLFTDAPPADPTMIIDGPDPTDGSLPSPPSKTTGPSGSMTSSPPTSVPNPHGVPDGGGGNQPPAGGGVANDNDVPAGVEPSWPPMVGDPTGANTGVPLGATLDDHYGDLRVTTPGQTVSDLRVTGTVIVDAPNVTLKRVLVVAPQGAAAVRQNANGLTVIDSELSGGTSLTQGTAGLTIRRSRLEAGVTITSGAQLFDCHLAVADVLVASNSSGILVRHNTFRRVTMDDLAGPVRNVTIENNLLNQVDAPTKAGSASIHVLSNRFRGNAPSTGWDSSAPDYRWSDNTYADSGAPASQ